MSHEDIDVDREPVRVAQNYQPPVVFDFGSVFEITRGSGSGSEDSSGQEYK